MAVDRTGLVLALCALLPTTIVGYIAWQQTSKLSSDETIVIQREQVRENLDDLLVAIKDAESSVRSYVVTGKQDFLSPYLEVVPKINDYEARLVHSIDTEADEKKLYNQLEPLISEKMDHMSQVVIMRQKHGFPAAADLMSLGKGQELMNKIRALMNQMRETEDRSVAAKTEAPSDVKGLVRVTLILTLFALVLVGINLFFMKFSR